MDELSHFADDAENVISFKDRVKNEDPSVELANSCRKFTKSFWNNIRLYCSFRDPHPRYIDPYRPRHLEKCVPPREMSNILFRHDARKSFGTLHDRFNKRVKLLDQEMSDYDPEIYNFEKMENEFADANIRMEGVEG